MLVDGALVLLYLLLAPSLTMGFKFVFSTLRFHFPLTTVWVLFIFEWLIIAAARRAAAVRFAAAATTTTTTTTTADASRSWSCCGGGGGGGTRGHAGVVWTKLGQNEDFDGEEEGGSAASASPAPELSSSTSPSSSSVGGESSSAAAATAGDAESWRRQQVRRAAPVGLLLAAEVGLSNLSLLTLSVAFHTMAKASTPAFVLLFSTIFGLERPNWKLAMSVVLVIGGIVLCSFGEVSFALSGFLLVVSASAAGGLRWVLSHSYLLQATADETAASGNKIGIEGGDAIDEDGSAEGGKYANGSWNDNGGGGSVLEAGGKAEGGARFGFGAWLGGSSGVGDCLELLYWSLPFAAAALLPLAAFLEFHGVGRTLSRGLFAASEDTTSTSTSTSTTTTNSGTGSRGGATAGAAAGRRMLLQQGELEEAEDEAVEVETLLLAAMLFAAAALTVTIVELLLVRRLSSLTFTILARCVSQLRVDRFDASVDFRSICTYILIHRESMKLDVLLSFSFFLSCNFYCLPTC
jgi:hypothetical protein